MHDNDNIKVLDIDGSKESTDDMLKYKQQIIDALDNPANNRNRVFENDDRSKNAMIMAAMFERCDEIIMYCGEMSIFRKDFYNHINHDYAGKGDEAEKAVKDAFESFVDNKKNRLSIILENYEQTYLDDIISPKFKESSNDNVNILKVNKDHLVTSILSHTTIGKKDDKVIIRRRETNRKAHSARCTVNLEPETAQDSVSLMSYIAEASIPVEIN